MQEQIITSWLGRQPEGQATCGQKARSELAGPMVLDGGGFPWPGQPGARRRQGEDVLLMGQHHPAVKFGYGPERTVHSLAQLDALETPDRSHIRIVQTRRFRVFNQRLSALASSLYFSKRHGL
jgi:hypothetical protein